MKTIPKIVQNTGQRKRNSSYAHPSDVNINPMPHVSSALTSVPPPFGTAQAIILKLAQLEAQLVLNLISNLTTGNQSTYGNPFVHLCLLQAATQRTPYLSMYQPPGVVAHSHLLHRRNVNSTTHMVNPPSSTSTMMSSVTEIRALTAKGQFQAKEVIQETTTGLQPTTSTNPLNRFSANHLGQNLSSVDSSQCKSMTVIKGPTNVRQVLKTLGEKGRDPRIALPLPSESLRKTLASLDLSLEDLELLSHCPDDHLTKEMLPLIIQDMQKRKGAEGIMHTSPESNMPRVIEYGHVSKTESLRKSSYTHGMQNGRARDSHIHGSLRHERFNAHDFIYKDLSSQSRTLKRDSSGRSKFFKRLQHGHAEVTRKRPASVRNSRHCFISPDHNKTKHYTTSNVMRKGHDELSFTTVTSKQTTESVNIQTPVNMENAKTSTQIVRFGKMHSLKQGVIRLSRIPLDFSENEIIKMTAPFGQPVEVLMGTEIDMVTHLEWKKALVCLPSEVSALEMVKVYSAIPPHMRQQSLELVSQTVDLTSSVSVFHAFVGPSMSNASIPILKDRLLVVCNVPHQPCAATGVLRLLKPFGKVFRTLVFNGNKVDVDQCLRNNDCIQMVLEMESAAVALSVYEWSQKIPCIYHNHHLSFIRGSNIKKNTHKVKST